MKKLLPAFLGLALGFAAFGCMEALAFMTPMMDLSPALCVLVACTVSFVCGFLFIKLGETRQSE